MQRTSLHLVRAGEGNRTSFSAWEIENGYFGDLQESRKSQLKNYFGLPLFTLRDPYFPFVVARIWHESIYSNGTTGMELPASPAQGAGELGDLTGLSIALSEFHALDITSGSLMSAKTSAERLRSATVTVARARVSVESCRRRYSLRDSPRRCGWASISATTWSGRSRMGTSGNG